MKRIAQFIDSEDPGGAEVLVVKICEQLKRRGLELEVLHFGNEWLKKKCEQANIPAFVVPCYQYYKSIETIPFFSINFARYLKGRRIDILHSHLFGSITGAEIAISSSRIHKGLPGLALVTLKKSFAPISSCVNPIAGRPRSSGNG